MGKHGTIEIERPLRISRKGSHFIFICLVGRILKFPIFLRIRTSWCHLFYVGQIMCRWNRETSEALSRRGSQSIFLSLAWRILYFYFCHEIALVDVIKSTLGKRGTVEILRSLRLSHRQYQLIFVSAVGCI